MIELHSLCAGYGKKTVLRDISLRCESGTLTAVLGPNGCGKSTLLKAVTGILPISGGQLSIDGSPAQTLTQKQRAQRLAYLSQGKAVPDITVERLVLHGRFPYLSYPRKYRPEDHAAARAAMEKLGLTALAQLPLAELSGGMRQKVYIAMALCQQARGILLDEPATYLDVSQQRRLSRLLRELAAEGKTVITVSHDILSALKTADQIALLENGALVSTGTPEQLLESGSLTRVFGVEIGTVCVGGETEFYYKEGAQPL